MSERRRTGGLAVAAFAGVIIGAVEALLAIAFATFVFGGLVAGHLSDGIRLYLLAGALTLGILAWLGGSRGVVGGLQEVVAAVLAVVATTTALTTFGGPDRAFLTVVAAMMVVTVLTGVAFLLLGAFKKGNLIRYVPYPVVGGFIAGIGWLLMRGGIGVAASAQLSLRTLGDFKETTAMQHWVPALAFGLLLLVVTRLIKRPLVLPVVLAVGLVLFVAGMLVSGQSLDDARAGDWLLGPFFPRPWEPLPLRALTDADWLGMLGQWAGIAAAVFVAVIVLLLNVSGIEATLRTDLDPNRELRDAGIANVVSGALGGIPGYHALGLTSLADGMNAGARAAGLVAALVPLAALVFGASVIAMIPRMFVGGVLVFLGLAFIVEWVWDKRRALPTVEYVVLLVILGGIVAKGFLPGVVLGLVMAVVLLAVGYGRIELVHEVAFGNTYHSNVDRPPAERAELRTMGDQVQILRVSGFVFFGSASALLERISKRAEASPPRFLVLDLGQVTGVDASAVVSLVKAVHLAEGNGFEIVFAAASERVRAQLERGGVVETARVVRFEPDLDRALERCEDALLEQAEVEPAASAGPADALGGLPPHLLSRLERVHLAEGTVLLHQDELPEDIFVLESGRLRVEMQTREGRRMRLRTVLPGVVVGEVAMYAGVARTADVVAEEPSMVLRLRRSAIERLEAEEPEEAAALHRWVAGTLAERLTDTQRAVDALFD